MKTQNKESGKKKKISWEDGIDPKKLAIIKQISPIYKRMLHDDDGGFLDKDDIDMIESQIKGTLEYYKDKNKKKRESKIYRGKK